MGHVDTGGYVMPLGKHRGKSIADLPSGYLRWLCGQDWFEERYEHLLEVAQEELRWRDEMDEHWEDD